MSKENRQYLPGHILATVESTLTTMKTILHQKTMTDRVVDKLRNSEFFTTYRDAFLKATNLPLSLETASEEGWRPCHGTENTNRFCQLLNKGDKACAGCSLACHGLAHDAENHLVSMRCFAGLSETAIPVRCGAQTIAFLSTGQVFNEAPKKRAFDRVHKILAEDGRKERQLTQLKKAYFNTPVVSLEQYRGITTLLAAFSLQLSTLASRVALEEENEPAPVGKAKQYISAHLDEKVTLEIIADHVGVSTFYFCKIFKSTTGMTLTEYINRRRVERAKHLLLRPNTPVTRIAYDVGYQSLSQFNRSFLKYAGCSPTVFREHETRGETLPLVA